MMIVTGAAGFIGSCLISKLNQHNFNYIVAADRFDAPEKERNLHHKTVLHRVDIDYLPDWLDQHYRKVEFIFHMNGRSYKDTDNQPDKLKELKLKFSKRIWQQSVAYQIPFLYISRETGNPDQPESDSDHSFEQWAMKQEKKPFYWACLVLPEVYGPNEYYLGSEASIIYRKYRQWEKNNSRQASFSWEHYPPVDLLYVKDVVEVCYYLMHYRKESGIYPLGTRCLYTEQQIINSLAAALPETYTSTLQAKLEKVIISPPEKLQHIGYERSFTPLAEGVQDYVQHYLKEWKYF